MILIAALSEDYIIGNGPSMPWSIPSEYNHFLSLVRGHNIIMGRKSWEIFGADLSETTNFVLSRTVDHFSGATVVPSLEEANQRASKNSKKIFCAGGSCVYNQALTLADQMMLSFIKGTYQGDHYFPRFDLSEWKAVRRDNHRQFRFETFHRLASLPA